MGNNSQDSDASAPDSSSDDSNSPPPAKSGSSSSPPPPEKSSPSPPSSPPPSPPSSPPPSPPSSPPPSPPIKSPTLTPPSADKISPPAPPGASASVSPPPVKKPPTTPAVPDSDRKPTPSGSVPASRGGGSSSSSSSLVPDNDQQSKGGSSNNTGLIAGVVVGVVLLLVIAGLCVAIFRRKKKKKSENQIWDSAYNYPDKYHAVSIPPQQGNRSSASYQSGWPQPVPPPPLPGPTSGFHYSTGVQQQAASPGSSPAQMSSGGSHGFSFDDLVAATNGFSSANMLGQGGFGFVHKGVLPNTGKVVAVKSLKSGSGQGEREFQSEVEIISRVHHRHLVSLVGYCISAAKRLLVYEFVPNNTLEFHLHQSGNVLDFSARLRIALGAAKGLAYLHEDCHPRIIHRDIKASNILLDYNFEAQVADFGLAKLTSDNNTHVSTRVMGTFGYLAPEYASSGKLTEKSDVFSFGVMLLELITGRRPVDPNDYNMMEDSLVDWARPLLTKALADKNYDALADPRLERNYNAQDMLSMVACAASSIRHSSKKRPRMSQIVRALEGQMSLDKLLEGGSKTTKSSDYDTAAYKADMSKFREIALGGSGDSSNDTSTNASSEFNLHT